MDFDHGKKKKRTLNKRNENCIALKSNFYKKKIKKSKKIKLVSQKKNINNKLDSKEYSHALEVLQNAHKKFSLTRRS